MAPEGALTGSLHRVQTEAVVDRLSLLGDDRDGALHLRPAVLGADPERFPALAHFAREVRPLGADRRAAFEEIFAAQLAHIEAAIRPSRPTSSEVSANDSTLK